MNNIPLETQLTTLGLNRYEAAVYLSLIGRKQFTAAEIASYASVPRQRVYDVLESLAAKGLCVERLGKRKRTYSAVDPSTALPTLLAAHREQQMLENQHRVAVLEAILPNLSQMFSGGQLEVAPLDYIEVLTDRRQVAEQVLSLSRQARQEILMLFKQPLVASIEENIAEAQAVAGRITRRGVYEESIADDTQFFNLVHQFHNLGEGIRFVPELPLKVNLYDEQMAVILLRDPVSGHSSLTCLVIKHTSMARALKVTFEALWAQGVDFEPFCAQRGLALPPL
ncbi:MAG: TrmB family transcriptional regulator [Anaerolineales bacterium]|nr:MAG: TrmB family transcriptional regulator [Anaerolineales bacterium]